MGTAMENREGNTQGHGVGPLVPAPRLAYRRPALVEYGRVSKLTEGATSGPQVDTNRGYHRGPL